MQRQSIPFVVIDEGEPTEAAYFEATAPAEGFSFYDDVRAFLRSKMADGTILLGIPDPGKMDEVAKRAMAEVVIQSGETKAVKAVAVWEDVQGDIQYEVLA